MYCKKCGKELFDRDFVVIVEKNHKNVIACFKYSG